MVGPNICTLLPFIVTAVVVVVVVVALSHTTCRSRMFAHTLSRCQQEEGRESERQSTTQHTRSTPTHSHTYTHWRSPLRLPPEIHIKTQARTNGTRRRKMKQQRTIFSHSLTHPGARFQTRIAFPMPVTRCVVCCWVASRTNSRAAQEEEIVPRKTTRKKEDGSRRRGCTPCLFYE